MALLVNILRLIVFFIVVKLIWGIITAVFMPNHTASKRSARIPNSRWARFNKSQVEDADYTEIQ